MIFKYVIKKGENILKIWEAILYGIFGGASSLLPISYTGHYRLIRETFNLTPLTVGSGLYVRCAICIGVILAIILAFRSESARLGKESLYLTGLRKRRRSEGIDRPYVRSILLFAPALILSLLSLIYAAPAERMGKLWIIAVLFVINGLLIFWCSKGVSGKKDEKTVLLSDSFLIGISRMISVFPGLSPLTSSLFVGQARSLSFEYNYHIAYMLMLAYEVCSLPYHLIRAIAYASFTTDMILPFFITLILSAAFGYLALQYLRYLLQRQKTVYFAFYCWDAAAVALVLSLVNA